MRVKIEHCIGVLKGRFSSLKGLRVYLARRQQCGAALDWVEACCVLHNMMVSFRDTWEEDAVVSGFEEAEDQRNGDNSGQLDTSNNAWRAAVQETVERFYA